MESMVDIMVATKATMRSRKATIHHPRRTAIVHTCPHKRRAIAALLFAALQPLQTCK
jgi:hypothetical protein